MQKVGGHIKELGVFGLIASWVEEPMFGHLQVDGNINL